MITFTLRDVAMRQLTIAVRVFTLLILGVVFFCYFKSIDCNSTVRGLLIILAIFTFAMLLGFFIIDHSKYEESPAEYLLAALFCLGIFVIVKHYLATFFYDDFAARMSDFSPYLVGYAIIYYLVVAFYLKRKKIKVSSPQGLIDEYKRALEQESDEAKFFTNDGGDLPNMAEMDKNLSKSIDIKTLK